MAAKAQQSIVSIGNQKVLDYIFILNRGCSSAGTASLLGRIVSQRLRLGIASLGYGDYAVLFGYQVFHSKVELRPYYFCSALITIFF